MSWISPRTIVGIPAERDKYYHRPWITDAIWAAVHKGEHVLCTAPRRVGKSSVLKYLESSAEPGTIVIYQDVETERTSKGFYKRLWGLVINQVGVVSGLEHRLTTWLHGRQIRRITLEGGFDFERADVNYRSELLDLIEALGKERVRVILLLDEFPDVVFNIANSLDEGPANAIELLNTMRGIRHDAKFRNFTFILAGSIGLEHVVSSLHRLSLINDLRRITVPPLTRPEAHGLLDMVLRSATMRIPRVVRESMFDKLQHLLPQHVQLLVEELDAMAKATNEPVIPEEKLSEGMAAVIKKNEHFVDWEQRLRRYLPFEDARYCEDILTRCAHGQQVTLQHAFDMSRRWPLQNSYRTLIDDVLVKDGYLMNEGGYFRFISPFLRDWWAARHPEFEITDHTS